MVHAGPWPRAHARRAPGRPDLTLVSDDELALAYVVHDDRSAFHALYERLFPYLVAVARRRVGSQEAAADLVQQAFLNAHLARDRFELGSMFRPWITRIVVNLCVDHCRAQQRRPLADLDPVELAAAPEDEEPDRAAQVALARWALASLKPEQRRVVEMHWLEERPFPEVARALEQRLSTVKVRAHRAYKEMRRAVERQGGGWAG